MTTRSRIPRCPICLTNLPAPRLQPSASYSFTMRLHMPQHGAVSAGIARAIADASATVGAIDLVRVESEQAVRDVTVACVDAAHAEAVVGAVRELEGVRVDSVSDRTFLMHKGGNVEIKAKLPIKTRDDLSMAYTPGVGRVSMAIHEDPAKAWALTIKSNTVAIVSDGTAVLGLGAAINPAGRIRWSVALPAGVGPESSARRGIPRARRLGPSSLDAGSGRQIAALAARPSLVGRQTTPATGPPSRPSPSISLDHRHDL